MTTETKLSYAIEVRHTHGGTELFQPKADTPTGSLWDTAYGVARRYQQDPAETWVDIVAHRERSRRWSVLNPEDGLHVVRAYVRPKVFDGNRPLGPEVVALPDEVLAWVRVIFEGDR